MVRSNSRQHGSGATKKKKKSSSSSRLSGRAVADNPLLQSLLSGSPAGTFVTMNKYAASTPSQSVNGDEFAPPEVSASALNNKHQSSQLPQSKLHTSALDLSTASALSPKSAAAAFARTSDLSFQQYLLNAAEGDWKLMQALSPKSLPQGIRAASEDGHDHRRMSASSNASGYTDRRSSTSSSAPFNSSTNNNNNNNNASIKSLDVNHSHISSSVEDDLDSVDDDDDDAAAENGPDDVSHSLVFSHSGASGNQKAFRSAGIADVTEIDFSAENDREEEGDGGADEELFDSKMYDDDTSSSGSEKLNASSSGNKSSNLSGNSGRYSRELKDTAGARALRTASGGSQSPARNKSAGVSAAAS